MELRLAEMKEIDKIMEIISQAKKHLKQQGINQWQNAYPDYDCICQDIENGRGYFAVDRDNILGYLCIDYEGEPAYDTIKGEWQTDEKYVVVHRIAFHEDARGKGISGEVFRLVEEMSKQRGIYSFRIDTDENNKKMHHILNKNGFSYRGIIYYESCEKMAFDKKIV